MTVLLQLVISGILVGCVFGLIAMGFVITYRSAHVFNMAYGQFAMVGAYAAWTFLGSPDSPRLPLWAGLVLTLCFAVSFGLFVERVFFRRMIGRPLFAPFMLTLGLMAFINAAVLLTWGPDTLAMAQTFPKGPVTVGGITMPQEYLWSFGVAMTALVAFLIFFRSTKLGLAIRAAYDNQIAARCLGVKAGFISQIAWVISSLLATIGGILIASVQGVSPLLGGLAISVLAVTILGGLDSLSGCIAGGIFLAVGGNLASYYLDPHLQGISEVFGVLLILIVLLIRPWGLFGTRTIERV